MASKKNQIRALCMYDWANSAREEVDGIS